MIPADPPRRIVELDAYLAALPPDQRACFNRIYCASATVGELVAPEMMHAWIVQQFGSVDAVRRQRIVKITNRITLEGALFNELRARRPVEAPPASADVEETIRNISGCAFCHPHDSTPADTFGRIRGKHCVTASNVAKYDGWHAVVIFDEHHPLRFSLEQVADYVNTAQAWARAAYQADPDACYPLFLWNCLWRSGASIVHGHAQMVLTRGMPYARVEAWRQAAQHYTAAFGADYVADLVGIYHRLGLAVEHGAATLLPSLTPAKDKETLIVAPHLDADLLSAVYHVLRSFVDRLHVRSFNLALYQPPLAETPEDWSGTPFLVRILDRGDLRSGASDVGAMEFFAQSVIATDPYRVADALRAGPPAPSTGADLEVGAGASPHPSH